jgi:hypothetical protein
VAARRCYRTCKQNAAVKKIEILKSIALKLLKQGRSISQVVYLTDLPYSDVNILKHRMTDLCDQKSKLD